GGCYNGTVMLWDANRQELSRLPGHQQTIYPVLFSPDSTTLASGDVGGTIILWDTVTGNKRWSVKGHPRGIRGLLFTAHGRTLASGDIEATIKLWDTATGAERTAP